MFGWQCGIAVDDIITKICLLHTWRTKWSSFLAFIISRHAVFSITGSISMSFIVFNSAARCVMKKRGYCYLKFSTFCHYNGNCGSLNVVFYLILDLCIKLHTSQKEFLLLYRYGCCGLLYQKRFFNKKKVHVLLISSFIN